MKLTCMTGRAGAVRKGALDFLAAALAAPGEGEALFLVPDQYTLQAEIEVLDGLNLPGSGYYPHGGYSIGYSRLREAPGRRWWTNRAG